MICRGARVSFCSQRALVASATPRRQSDGSCNYRKSSPRSSLPICQSWAARSSAWRPSRLARTSWTVGRRGLTITAPVHPFEWRDSGSTGVVVGHPFDSDASVPFEARTVAARTLRSLSAQRLDHGSLQTLSDPTSDLRVLVVHDDLGRRVRAATMEAPLGIVGTSPPRHELLAVRTPGAADVATYRRYSHTPSSLCRLRSFVRSDSDDGCGTVDR